MKKITFALVCSMLDFSSSSQDFQSAEEGDETWANHHDEAQPDVHETLDLLKQAADKGFVPAQARMVDLLVNNKKDVESAAPYLKQLIKVHPERLDFKLYMGVHYLYTATAERNEEYGIKLIEEVLAKDPGNWRATETLGLYYILKDLKTGIAWLEKILAEDKNNTTAAILLGRYYIRTNETKGIAWFEKILAEHKNNVTVIKILGDHYLQKGRALGTSSKKKNDEEVTAWVRKAAELGHAEAQYKLAHAYAEGIGTPIDLKQALVWYRKANAQGYTCEKEIKKLEKQIK